MCIGHQMIRISIWFLSLWKLICIMSSRRAIFSREYTNSTSCISSSRQHNFFILETSFIEIRNLPTFSWTLSVTANLLILVWPDPSLLKVSVTKSEISSHSEPQSRHFLIHFLLRPSRVCWMWCVGWWICLRMRPLWGIEGAVSCQWLLNSTKYLCVSLSPGRSQVTTFLAPEFPDSHN